MGQAIVDSGETNPCDADTDQDGIQDGTESGINSGVPDPDGDGPLQGTSSGVFVPDLDSGVTTTNPINPDSDGDGAKDGEEDINRNGIVDAGESDPNDSNSLPKPVQVPVLPHWAFLVLGFIVSLITIGTQQASKR